MELGQEGLEGWMQHPTDTCPNYSVSQEGAVRGLSLACGHTLSSRDRQEGEIKELRFMGPPEKSAWQRPMPWLRGKGLESSFGGPRLLDPRMKERKEFSHCTMTLRSDRAVESGFGSFSHLVRQATESWEG